MQILRYTLLLHCYTLKYNRPKSKIYSLCTQCLPQWSRPTHWVHKCASSAWGVSTSTCFHSHTPSSTCPGGPGVRRNGVVDVAVDGLLTPKSPAAPRSSLRCEALEPVDRGLDYRNALCC